MYRYSRKGNTVTGQIRVCIIRSCQTADLLSKSRDKSFVDSVPETPSPHSS